MKEILIIRGLPGSGKTTLAKKIAADLGAAHVEADMFWGDPYRFDYRLVRQAHEWCLAETCRQLHINGKVIVSNTFTWQREIDSYVALAKHMEAKISYVNCHGDFGSSHNVPAHVIENMKARWQEELCLS